MFVVTSRLGTLDPKGKFATRTAKDGEEYSQLIFEVTEVELGETEVNAVFGSPHAFAKLQELAAAVKGIKAVEVEEKFEKAWVGIRLNAVDSSVGDEYKFENCVVDKLKLSGTAGETMMSSFRVTSKPALNGKFGELVARLGHTIMIEVRGNSAADQKELPLNGHAGDADPTVSQLGKEIQASAARSERKRRSEASRAKDAFN